MSWRGADRALDAAQRVAREQVLEPARRRPAARRRRREALAERGRLRRRRCASGRPSTSVVVLDGQRARGGRATATTLSRTISSDDAHLQLLDVLGEVARRHALVDVLVAGERAELLDARLHVVAGDPLAGARSSRGRPGRRRARRPRRRRRARRARGRAAPRAPRSTAGARARSCARATRSAPSPRRRSGRPGRRGSRACSRTRLSQPAGARDHAPGRWTSPRAAASAMSVRWWAPRSRIAATRLVRVGARVREVAPTPDHRQHPAAGRHDRSPSAASAVPACSTHPSAAAALDRVAGDAALPGSPAAATTTVTAAPSRPAQRRRARRACRWPRRAAARPSGVSSRASTTWVSGSPKRALNSTTRSPREVSASPA